VLDADAPPPRLEITLQQGSPVLSWPLSAVGFALEASPSPGGTWTNIPEPLEIVGDRNYVTNSAGGDARYYRLHLR
jgi:hypothetical protein